MVDARNCDYVLDRRGFSLLKAAATANLPCPSNSDFCSALGWASQSGAANMLARLEGKGLIRVWRFARSRVVEIVSSGEKTAPTGNTTPHWRIKRMAGD